MKNKVFLSLAVFFFLIFSFLKVIDVSCFDRGFYEKKYHELNTAETMKISEEDLSVMTDVLLDYLKDGRDDLSVKIHVEGKEAEGFNQREIDHMVDVKKLYQMVCLVMNLAFGGFVISLLALIIKRKQIHTKDVLKAYQNVLMFFFAAITALGFYALLDFDSFWTSFHHVFFTNDLWLLNPATDRLILMVPSAFFSALVTKIVILVLLVWMVPYLFMFWVNRRRVL